MLDEICSVFAFSEQVFQAAFLQFGDTAKEIWGVQRGITPLWRWVSNRGASIPIGTRFSAGKSSVLYLCFRLTRERGRRTLQQGRVWRQTLWVGPSGMLGVRFPWSCCGASHRPSSRLSCCPIAKNNHLKGNYEVRKYIEKPNCSI